MIYKVTGIIGTEDAQWQGLDRTYFNANNQTLYMLHQPGNAPKVGDELDGTVAPDKRQNLKFTKTKTFQQQPSQQTAPRPSAPQERQFKADPAKQESIEWQACLKAAVDAVHHYHELFGMLNGEGETLSLEDYKREIVNAVVTFTQTVEKKPDHTLTPPAPVEPEPEPDLPPVENYDAQVDVDGEIDLSDIPF